MSLITYRKEDTIGILTFDNPKMWNLVGQEFWQELYAHQEEIEKDKALRVLVVNQTGEHFSAGIDLKYLKDNVNPQFIMDNLQWLQRLYSRWQEMPFPVLASIKGLCYGSAMEFILGCDIRIAAENARFSIPEVRFGLSPDMGGTARLTHLVGPGQAKRMIMCCEEINAEEALRIGLVEEVVENEKLEERTMKLAERLAGLPPIAVRFAKKGINLAAESSLQSALLFEQAQSTFCCGTYDQQEGITAFLEKRKAVPEGR